MLVMQGNPLSEANQLPTVNDPAFWENFYQANTTPWDLGTSSPPFNTFMQSPYAPKPGNMAVLGCGTGHDAMFFAKHGFNITAIDFAPYAVAVTKAKFAEAGILDKSATVIQKDIFDLHGLDGKFDYVLEHTCFCAIDPPNRNRYSYTVRDLLKPSGRLIGLWWLLDRQSKLPPFSVSKSEIFDLFSQDFIIDLAYEPTDSVPDRKGKELLTIMSRIT